MADPLLSSSSMASAPPMRAQGRLRWAWPLIPFGLSVFFLSALAYYHVQRANLAGGSVLQRAVVGLYEGLGFVPAFMLCLLVLAWSSIWFITGRIEAPLARLVRVLVLTVSLAVLVNLEPAGQALAPHSGAVGGFLAPRFVSVFGFTISTILVSLIALVSLLFATDFFFYRWFDSLAAPAGEAAPAPAPREVEPEVIAAFQSLQAPLASRTPRPASAVPARADRLGDDDDADLPDWPVEDASAEPAEDDGPRNAAPTAVEEPRWLGRRRARAAEEEAAETAADEEAAALAAKEAEDRDEDEVLVARVEEPTSLREASAPRSEAETEDAIETRNETGDEDEAEEETGDEGEDGSEAEAAEDEAAAEAEADEAEADDETEAEDDSDEDTEDTDSDTEDALDDDTEDDAAPGLPAFADEPTLLDRSAPRAQAPSRSAGEPAPDDFDIEDAIDPGLPPAEGFELPRPDHPPVVRQRSLFLGAGGDDGVLDEAARIVIEQRRANAALLQRRLRISYDDAVDLLDRLRQRGVIDGAERADAGRVLVTPEEWEQQAR